MLSSFLLVSALLAADTRLVDAARTRDAAAFLALLKSKADVNQASADGATALSWAAHWDDASMADQLIRDRKSTRLNSSH